MSQSVCVQISHKYAGFQEVNGYICDRNSVVFIILFEFKKAAFVSFVTV